MTLYYAGIGRRHPHCFYLRFRVAGASHSLKFDKTLLPLLMPTALVKGLYQWRGFFRMQMFFHLRNIIATTYVKIRVVTAKVCGMEMRYAS